MYMVQAQYLVQKIKNLALINQNSLRLDNKANVIRTTCTHWLYSPTALPYWQCCICHLYLHLRIETNRFIISASSVLLVMNATRTECYA